MTRLPTKQPKYRNTKCEFNGIKFDSKLERDYYKEKIYPLEKTGLYTVEFQPRFKLVPSFTRKPFLQEIKFRGVRYTADFRLVFKDGSERLYEVKGMKTRDYIIRRKLFHWLNPDRYIIEVTKKKGKWDCN